MDLEFTPEAEEILIALKVETNAPNLKTVISNSIKAYRALLKIANGKDYVWVEVPNTDIVRSVTLY